MRRRLVAERSRAVRGIGVTSVARIESASRTVSAPAARERATVVATSPPAPIRERAEAVSISAVEGSGAGCQGTGAWAGTAPSKRTVAISTAATPSTSAWWAWPTIANCSGPSPVTSCSRHSGRSRSSGRESRRPAISSSRPSPLPGTR